MGQGRRTDEIEREIEAERVALARTLEGLQEQFSSAALSGKAMDYVVANSGDIADVALRRAKNNPLAVVLTGAGLAWLALGKSGSGGKNPAAAFDDRPTTPVSGFRTNDPTESFEARLEAARTAEHDPALHGAPSTSDATPDLQAQMTKKAEVMAERARAAAAAAELRLEAEARKLSAAGKAAVSQKPLMATALAFGAGALLGALLPKAVSGAAKSKTGAKASPAHPADHRFDTTSDAALARTLEAAKAGRRIN